MRRRIRNPTRKTVTGHVGYTPNTIHHARRVLNYFLTNPKEELTETVIAYRCCINGAMNELLFFMMNCGMLKKKKNKKLTTLYYLNPSYRRFYKKHESSNLSQSINA